MEFLNQNILQDYNGFEMMASRYRQDADYMGDFAEQSIIMCRICIRQWMK